MESLGNFDPISCSNDDLGLTLTSFYGEVRFVFWCFYMEKCLDVRVHGTLQKISVLELIERNKFMST